MDDVKRLPVKNGDIVLIRLPYEPTTEAVSKINNEIRKPLHSQGFPGVDVIVVGPDVEVSVITPTGPAVSCFEKEKITEEQRGLLMYKTTAWRRIAEAVGPQHSAWDFITDAEAALRGEKTILSTDELLSYSDPE
ncbi:hypothetical protein [Roseibium sp. Sym1]|uniref:hypothetical protein n=1 Tax=Roseibium sp. Sym1 TaxID=3016006 RepID=UPI0022B577D2|nr:hypothetical protein [Roseibium sp. Sym1]